MSKINSSPFCSSMNVSVGAINIKPMKVKAPTDSRAELDILVKLHGPRIPERFLVRVECQDETGKGIFLVEFERIFQGPLVQRNFLLNSKGDQIMEWNRPVLVENNRRYKLTITGYRSVTSRTSPVHSEEMRFEGQSTLFLR